jgi:hypothetical protein
MKASIPSEDLLFARQRGNLQDVISHQSITNQRMSEKEMLRLFKGTCLA